MICPGRCSKCKGVRNRRHSSAKKSECIFLVPEAQEGGDGDGSTVGESLSCTDSMWVVPRGDIKPVQEGLGPTDLAMSTGVKRDADGVTITLSARAVRVLLILLAAMFIGCIWQEPPGAALDNFRIELESLKAEVETLREDRKVGLELEKVRLMEICKGQIEEKLRTLDPDNCKMIADKCAWDIYLWSVPSFIQRTFGSASEAKVVQVDSKVEAVDGGAELEQSEPNTTVAEA